MTAVWLTGVATGLWAVWAYENRPGTNAQAPVRWPAHSTLVPASDRPTLLFVAHPQCTCTRASLDELAEVLARAATLPKTYVLFLRPTVFDPGWEQADLWRRAEALPEPDLILMDLGLPGIDGWEATAQLKKDGETQHIPIIVLSAHAMTNDREKALAAGGDDFDTKPVQFTRLLGKMETLLAKDGR